ncbi:MAG: mandelate racemase/muconate lactonizing enzyme family protein [Candidatus Latescibacterota bacterium]|nr:mandelate racemase/muconate lactonizing enzyme family protein [Candidatus Latescibacterota bacterium]
MRIADAKVHQVAVPPGYSWAFVEVVTDEGITGIGEMNPSAPRSECLQALRQIAENLRGEDPRQIIGLTRRLMDLGLDSAGVVALSAVEQGLWDLLGKSLHAPLYQLLGGRCHADIHLYANITRATYELTPEAFARSAAGAVANGFDTVKIAPLGGRLFERDRAASIANAIDCVHTVRDTIGPDVDLMLDCYGILDVDEALLVANEVAGANLYWLEEPVAEADVDGYRRVKAESGLRLAGGERSAFRQGFHPALDNHMVDVVMPDVSICGGVADLHHMAAMAQARGMMTAPHGPFGPVIEAVQAQVMMAHPGFLILEYAWGQVDWREQLILPAEQIIAGRMVLSDRPGHGIELDQDTLKAHKL